MLSKRNSCYTITAKKNPTIHILLDIKDEDYPVPFKNQKKPFYLSLLLFLALQNHHHNPHFLLCGEILATCFFPADYFLTWPYTFYDFVSLLFVLHPLIALPRPWNTSVTNGNWVPEVYICSYNFQNSTHERDRPFTERTHSELSALFCYCTIKEPPLKQRGTFKKEVQERTINT